MSPRAKPRLMTEHEASRTIVKSAPELWAECSDSASLARHLGQFGEIRITKLEPETAVAWEGELARGTVRLEPAGWGTRVILTARPPGQATQPPGQAARPPGHQPSPGSSWQREPASDHHATPESPRQPAPRPAPAPHPTPAGADHSRARRGAVFGRVMGILRRAPGPGWSPASDPHLPPAHQLDRPPRDQTPRRATPPAPPRPAAEQPAPAPPPPRATPASPSGSRDRPGSAGGSVPQSGALPDPRAALTSALDSLGQAHHRPYSRA